MIHSYVIHPYISLSTECSPLSGEQFVQVIDV
jgi:hypothetical protein